jgi:nucleotide-binding universal stress UspA family protein
VTVRRKATASKRARILAYVDPGARNASLLDQLVRLARREQREVDGLYVLRELPWYVRGRQAKPIRDALEREAAAALEQEVEPLVRAGVTVRTHVAWGRPFEVIIREALRRQTRVVMKTAHAPGGDRRAGLFGSTDMHLFRKCPVPVWVVKPRRTRRIARVLAAVDPAEPTPDEVDLNTEIVRIALDIATGEKAELHVCHAFSTLSELVLGDASRAYVADFKARVEEAMARLVAPFGLALRDRRVHILHGDAGEVIPRFVRRRKVDLLVMGTIARAGLPGLLIGNTAERMLELVDCSVLAIKPEGFVSPIQLQGRRSRPRAAAR